jgi:hypothetical protein
VVAKSSNAQNGSLSCEITATKDYGGLRQFVPFGAELPAGCSLTAEVWIRDGAGSGEIDLNLTPHGSAQGSADKTATTKNPWKKLSVDIQLTAPADGITLDIHLTKASEESVLVDNVSLTPM